MELVFRPRLKVDFVKSVRVFICIYVGLLTQCVAAKDYFLTIGGGPTPQNNQVSLESNVLFSQRVLTQAGVDADQQQVFFSDGKVANPDLQFLVPDAQLSDGVEWMCRLFGDESSTRYEYRNHRVEPINGPTRKAFLKQSFDELADLITADDRLILYVTAHGGAADDDNYDDYYSDDAAANPYDTTIALWDDDSLTVSELDGWLNRFSPDCSVVLIMAQCHSGGFANSIFHAADKKRGLNPQLRIGFFSQRHDRAAAGCTPEIDEKEYREYSTYFWEAIGGMTRGGQRIESPDYDHDGLVSFAEAHAHAMIKSDNIDIPISTSDVFLRKFSRFAPSAEDTEDEASSGGFLGGLFGSGGKKKEAKKSSAKAKPLGRDESIANVLKLARPEQKAIINRIAKDLKVKHDETVQRIRRRASKWEQSANNAVDLWSVSAGVVSTETRLLADNVSLQWPQLERYSISPKMMQLTGTNGNKFVEYVEALPGCDSLQKAQQRADDLEIKMDRSINREAKLRRLVRTCENVILESNLPHFASETEQAHFAKMSTMQRQGL